MAAVQSPWVQRQESLRRLVDFARTLTPAQLSKLSESDRLEIALAVEQLELADPVIFSERVLGIRAWSRQAEIMRAVRDHERVAVRSGHKVSKSCTAACLALWYYHNRPNSLVVLTSSTDDQVRLILWAELRRLYLRAPELLGGELHESHRVGLTNKDGRRIVGLASNKGENMAGFSGMDLLFIADESSGIEDTIFDAIEGNRAGGARILMLGNPTRQSGRFYEAFHDERGFWHQMHVSSEETPNVTEGRIVVPGLATREYIEEKRAEWGENSPLYMIRIKGDFPDRASDAVIGLDLVESASVGWRLPVPTDGPLEIGVDVARFGEDDTVIQARRGLFAYAPVVFGNSDIVRVVSEIKRVLNRLTYGDERPLVRVDGSGVGGGVVDLLRKSRDVEVTDANASARPTNEDYSRLRDQLWGGLRDWLRAGGKVPHDRRLAQEMAAPTYSFDTKGRIKVENKDDIRKKLRPQRSPDRADALALAVHTRTATASADFTAPPYQDEPVDYDQLALDKRIDDISWGR